MKDVDLAPGVLPHSERTLRADDGDRTMVLLGRRVARPLQGLDMRSVCVFSTAFGSALPLRLVDQRCCLVVQLLAMVGGLESLRVLKEVRCRVAGVS
jgi:hypothetical protein